MILEAEAAWCVIHANTQNQIEKQAASLHIYITNIDVPRKSDGLGPFVTVKDTEVGYSSAPLENKLSLF